VAIEKTLASAKVPMSVDEICTAVWGRCGTRERGTVHQNLHRLDLKGRLVKQAMRYSLKD